ncbi:MAG: hypothetical protein ACXADA_06640 [Candidatus Hodarchaeales archaeon]
MDKNDVWNTAQLMQISVDLSVYRQTLAYALGNLIIMTIISSGLIIVEVLTDSFLLFLVFWVIISFGAIIVHVYVFRHVFRRIRIGFWVFAYPVTFIIGYFANSILNNPISVYYLWYPLVGTSSLIIGLTSEKDHFSNNKLFARPILTIGLVILISSPVVLLVLVLLPGVPVIFITSGIALVLASLSTSFSMAQAEKKVVNK